MNAPAEETTVTAEMTAGLCALRIRHPPGTFALTPASLISLHAIGEHQRLLAGHGIDRAAELVVWPSPLPRLRRLNVSWVWRFLRRTWPSPVKTPSETA
jgi:hypothetical protein